VQLLVLLAASAGWATLGIAVLSMVFVTQTPTWTCTSADDAFCQQQLQLKDRNSALCSLQEAQIRWDNPGSSLVSTFGLVCDRSWLVGLANASFFIGCVTGPSGSSSSARRATAVQLYACMCKCLVSTQGHTASDRAVVATEPLRRQALLA